MKLAGWHWRRAASASFELVRAKVIEKKSGTVVLQAPARRVRKRGEDLPGVNPDARSLFQLRATPCTRSYSLLLMSTGLPGAARALLDRAGLTSDASFAACLQGLVNASVPRTKSKGECGYDPNPRHP